MSVPITTQNFIVVNTNSYFNNEASSLDSQMPITAALADFATKQNYSIFDKKPLIFR